MCGVYIFVDGYGYRWSYFGLKTRVVVFNMAESQVLIRICMMHVILWCILCHKIYMFMYVISVERYLSIYLDIR